MTHSEIYKIKQFLSVVNGVTVFHRHGRKIPKAKLDNLSNKQIDMEEWIKEEEKQS